MANYYFPVKVHVRELVSQLLDVVCAERGCCARVLLHDDKVRRRHRALVDVLRYEEEILVLVPGHRVVQDGAGRGIFIVALK